MSFLSPAYSGVIELPRIPDDFTDRIERRVETGLLTPGSRRRANYVVRSKSADSIAFSAVGFWTQYNVGLNEVELRRDGPSRISYHGSFRPWARAAAIYAFALAAVILVGFLVWPGARADISRYAWGWPFLGGLLVFFGLLWPWLLVAIHRRFVPRALERIVRETLGA